jgi:hypothetical protein
VENGGCGNGGCGKRYDTTEVVHPTHIVAMDARTSSLTYVYRNTQHSPTTQIQATKQNKTKQNKTIMRWFPS